MFLVAFFGPSKFLSAKSLASTIPYYVAMDENVWLFHEKQQSNVGMASVVLVCHKINFKL